jgi:hypothetical protein
MMTVLRFEKANLKDVKPQFAGAALLDEAVSLIREAIGPYLEVSRAHGSLSDCNKNRDTECFR